MLEYTTAFLHSDWLYFLWHGNNIKVHKSYIMKRCINNIIHLCISNIIGLLCNYCVCNLDNIHKSILLVIMPVQVQMAKDFFRCN